MVPEQVFGGGVTTPVMQWRDREKGQDMHLTSVYYIMWYINFHYLYKCHSVESTELKWHQREQNCWHPCCKQPVQYKIGAEIMGHKLVLLLCMHNILKPAMVAMFY